MKRILVVDDSLNMRIVIPKCVEIFTEGLETEVETAEDGRIALARILAGGIDLVLTDNEMPEMTGSELVIALREQGCTIPVIMLTGDVDELIPIAARRLLQGIERKPINFPTLGELIRRNL